MFELDEHVLSDIICYNNVKHDYTRLFKNKSIRKKIFKCYKNYVQEQFAKCIINTFSTLYYMNFLRRPRTRDEINSVFLSLDYHGLFQDPNYYDLKDYLKVFKMFIQRSMDYNVTRQPLLDTRKKKHLMSIKHSSLLKHSYSLKALNLF